MIIKYFRIRVNIINFVSLHVVFFWTKMSRFFACTNEMKSSITFLCKKKT